MAKTVFTDAYVLLNTTSYAGQVRSVALDYSADMVDTTAMGDGGKRVQGGLKDWSLTIEVYQDASLVDQNVFPLVGAAAFPVEIRATSAAVSATNPRYTGSGVLESYNPVSGSVGSELVATLTIRGSSALTRATV